MPLLRGRECSGCGNRYEVLQHTDGTSLPLDNEGDDDSDDCPKCGCPEFQGRLTGPGTGIALGGEAGVGKLYPHWNRNLGCMVNSAAHMRKICEERGLVQIDGDVDKDRAARLRFNASADRGAEIVKQMESEPWYREMKAKTDGFKRAKVEEYQRERRTNR